MLKEKGSQIKLGNDYEYAEYLERKILEEKQSPKAVLGHIRKHNIHFNTTISVNTFYSYIRKGYFSTLEMKHLPKGNQKKKKQHIRVNKKAPKGTSIEQRPLTILERTSFGHWEMDCVCGPTKESLLVLSERLTRKEIIMPIKTQSTKEVVKALNKLEYKFGRKFKSIFKTITVDNGTEFSDCQGIEKSIYGKGNRTKVYYCHPYSSWERGTNERINREIRRLIPKGTNLANVTEAKYSTWKNG
jgi:IS30 family transposase